MKKFKLSREEKKFEQGLLSEKEYFKYIKKRLKFVLKAKI